MNIKQVRWPSAGTHIVAVSGGADSMVLLDLLAAVRRQRGYRLVVAHFDHRMRSDSGADLAFTAAAAGRYGLLFAPGRAERLLKSEASARAARYAFLRRIKRVHRADSILTAHHLDDLIETSLLNLTRGTAYRGLLPMRDEDSGDLGRPLLDLRRIQLREYAARHHLVWREDPTNADLASPRNFMRHRVLAGASDDWMNQYLALLTAAEQSYGAVQRALDRLIGESVQRSEDSYRLPRRMIAEKSPIELAALLTELVRRLQPGLELNRRLITELSHFAKTAQPGRRRPVRPPLSLHQEREACVLLKLP